MDTVVRYVIRDGNHKTVTLCETREQAQWMAFMLGQGHYFGMVTDRKLLAFLKELENEK